MKRSDPQIFEPGYYRRLFEIERRHWWSRGLRRAMRVLLRRAQRGREAERLLDVGCGTGYLLEAARAWGLAGRAVGVDVSLQALALYREKTADGTGAPPGRPTPNPGARDDEMPDSPGQARGAFAPTEVRRVGRWNPTYKLRPAASGVGTEVALAAASAPELPLANGSFDLVLCVDVLQHLSPAGADRRALAEFARLLAPGGVLCLRTNSALGHRRLRGADPNLYRRYRRRDLVEMATAAGLEVERATYLNCLPSLPGMLKELLHPAVAQTPPSGPALSIRTPSGPRASIGEILHAVLAAEAWWVGRGLDLPFGHSLALIARKPLRQS